MALTTVDLMQVAKDLYAKQTEPNCRSSTSRAYYAAFHQASAWHRALPRQGKNTGPSGGDHQQLINMLAHPDSSIPLDDQLRSRLLAKKIETLRDRRHFADYDLKNDQGAGDARTQLVQAQDVVNNF